MITEVIEFKLKATTNEENFLLEVENFSKYFTNVFAGFLDLEFTKGEIGWITIMHWKSMNDVMACGVTLRSNPVELAGYSSLVDKESTRITILEQKYVHTNK